MKLNSRILAWWYAAIAVGFALLAVDHMLLRDRPLLVILRLVLAGGFAFLAHMQFRRKQP